jgi:hypothetical protein
LAPTSMLGVIGFAATTVVMGIRYIDGSYAPGGKYETVSIYISKSGRFLHSSPALV